MSSHPRFSTQVIGQAEKTLNAILKRQLAGTGLTEPQWITLTLTAASGGSIDRDKLAGRVAGALKVSGSKSGGDQGSGAGLYSGRRARSRAAM